MTKDNKRFWGVIPFIKVQNNQSLSINTTKQPITINQHYKTTNHYQSTIQNNQSLSINNTKQPITINKQYKTTNHYQSTINQSIYL